MQHEEKLQWYTTLTTSISVAIFLGLFGFLIYTHFQKLRCYLFRTPSEHNAPRQTPHTPTQGTQQNTNEQRDTNTEQEVIFTAYSMQPTQGCSWRQLYHNGLDWNLQIDAVLAFSAQCPRHCSIKPISVAITTAHRAQAVTSCSELFAKPKCYYALTITTFGLRLNLINYSPYCYVCRSVPNLVTKYVFLSLGYSYLYILHSRVCTFMLWYVNTLLISSYYVNVFFIFKIWLT